MKHEPSTSDAASTSLGVSQSDADLPEGSTPPLGLDGVFDALRHPRRRYLLSALADESELSLTSLATDIVAWEDDVPREDVRTEARERCRIALHHVHLPKLAEFGIVDYEPGDEPTVRAADTDSVTAVLDGVDAELDTAPGTPLDQDGA